ncbi:hypothetical protein [Desulfovibrio sp. ZJ369]|uniref:hypothetical protein n=1 Tax=Desulfovibrio sp. ZJ369 TaxID=2709793 RepID=UPI0013EB2743|nr:hypothetical protein [Desulfovibrio sp. ZJ369]
MERKSGNKRARGKKPPAPEKDRYGENGNVLLTRPQYENLCARFGKERTDKAIVLLDLHIGAKGRDAYKDHNLALQRHRRLSGRQGHGQADG